MCKKNVTGCNTRHNEIMHLSLIFCLWWPRWLAENICDYLPRVEAAVWCGGYNWSGAALPDFQLPGRKEEWLNYGPGDTRELLSSQDYRRKNTLGKRYRAPQTFGKKCITMKLCRQVVVLWKKIAIYCPQGSGTLRQQSLMMHWLCQSMPEHARVC